ncbi:hypothetical protein SteCoe_17796 [Stentor coeruleus]|uniref:Zinc ribbon domain-containing protein n=1 Tax=Stentor coeruleus TaxID=5963 RepID=A0A1R2BYG4_9CILI|nr:hypothetical protein SteCoe_17796 [Stentor coeruleus]
MALNEFLMSLPILVTAEFLMSLPILVTAKEKELTLKVEGDYNGLRRALSRDFKISETSKLEFLDDYGESQPIKDDQSYFECLKCCNGQAHYMNVVEIKTVVNPEPISPTKPIFCIRCQAILTAGQSKCKICGFALAS